MALNKVNRLKGKDVTFLTRKRQYIGAGLFGFFYWSQYPNIDHHQISCHITIKLSKRSTHRNMRKRTITDYIQTSKSYASKIANRRYKIFIVVNKTKLEEWLKTHKYQTDIEEKQAVRELFIHARQSFQQKITTK